MNRPYPPHSLLQPSGRPEFVAAPEVDAWARATFLDELATIANEDHAHLQQATIGYLWTNEVNEKKGKLVLGTCQLLPPTGDKWTAARSTQQLLDWFEDMPDFLITLFAPAAADMDNASFMALVEHELYHAAQKLDKWGAPMFNRETGAPLWGLRGHDVEQFVGVVRRYGAKASGVEELVEAAQDGPTIAPARISIACGNCLRLVS